MIVTRERCNICGKVSNFKIKDGATLFRDATCEFCGSSIRSSDLAYYLVKTLLKKDSALENCADEMERFKILNTSSRGSIHMALKKLESYICSEFYDDYASGEVNTKNGILCVDLREIPFLDNSLDCIISEDVLEHVENWEDCIQQIKKKLKVGGIHIFTVPVHENKNTKSRLFCEHKIYHGDPLRNQGALVLTDFGDDLVKILCDMKFKTKMYKAHKFYDYNEITDCDLEYDEYLKKKDRMECFFRYNSVVFISVKE